MHAGVATLMFKYYPPTDSGTLFLGQKVDKLFLELVLNAALPG